MKKEYILTFCISFLILLTIVVISLMILLPQQTTLLGNSVEQYSSIKKSDYTFKQTNGLSFDNLVKEYNITDEQISVFRNNGQYIAGNSDPFTAEGTSSLEQTNSGKNNTTTNNTNTSTQDKITNSNGGVKNPASTGK